MIECKSAGIETIAAAVGDGEMDVRRTEVQAVGGIKRTETPRREDLIGGINYGLNIWYSAQLKIDTAAPVNVDQIQDRDVAAGFGERDGIRLLRSERVVVVLVMIDVHVRLGDGHHR